MQRVVTKTHAGSSIIEADFTDLRGPEALDAVREMCAAVQSQPPLSALVLMKIAGLRFNPMLGGAVREAARGNGPHTRGIAFVGASGLHAVFIRGAQRIAKVRVELFEREDEARAWLLNLDRQAPAVRRAS